MVPILAAGCVIGVLVETIRTASTLGPGQWIAAVTGMLAGSSIAYLSGLRSRVVFDAERNEVTWHHIGWPGRDRGSCPLEHVTDVQVHSDTSRASRLVIHSPAGVIPLTRHFTGFDRHEQCADAIRKWLAQHGRHSPEL